MKHGDLLFFFSTSLLSIPSPLHSPHPHCLHPKEILQLLRGPHTSTGHSLPLVISQRSWAVLRAVNEGHKHLQLGESPSHSIGIQTRQSSACAYEERLNGVAATSFQTRQTSDTRSLSRERMVQDYERNEMDSSQYHHVSTWHSSPENTGTQNA